jgi:hypothetical protein
MVRENGFGEEDQVRCVQGEMLLDRDDVWWTRDTTRYLCS